jgi:hypothetical protein
MQTKGKNGKNMAESRDLEWKRDHEGIWDRKLSLTYEGREC